MHDLWEALGVAVGRSPTPRRDPRRADSPVHPEERAAGRVRRAPADERVGTNESKVHLAVDTPGNLPAQKVTPASAQERGQVFALGAAVREATCPRAGGRGVVQVGGPVPALARADERLAGTLAGWPGSRSPDSCPTD